MDKNDVQKWIPRYPFGKKRAALGNLRNFFGAIIGRPYMQWEIRGYMKHRFFRAFSQNISPNLNTFKKKLN